MKTYKSRICKGILSSLLAFLCACGSSNMLKSTSEAVKADNGVRYNTSESPIKSDDDGLANGATAIIREGNTKVYRRSSIENAEEPLNTEDFKSLTVSERAKKISQAITEIKGIEKATAVISGRTAIVGIEYMGHLDDMLLMKLKREVDRIAKAADPGITNVAVTASPELVGRVMNMTDSESSEKSTIEYME